MVQNTNGKPQVIPSRCGVGLKAEHYQDILETKPDIGWFEVHPENYMGAGGPPHHYLTKIRENYPLSLHGVGLSIGSAKPLDMDHVTRFADLVKRYEPGLVSEHLAWSSHDEGYFNDLLPLPYTEETMKTVCAHINEFQEAIARPMLLENPSVYVEFDTHDYGETEFLGEIAKRTGCGLLLDVNNVIITCNNTGADPYEYVDKFPLDHVGEIHLAGHDQDKDDNGDLLLIDSHDREVDDKVWSLYETMVAKAGSRPSLVEWDADIPTWKRLHAEAKRAEAVMTKTLESTGDQQRVA